MAARTARLAAWRASAWAAAGRRAAHRASRPAPFAPAPRRPWTAPPLPRPAPPQRLWIAAEHPSRPPRSPRARPAPVHAPPAKTRRGPADRAIPRPRARQPYPVSERTWHVDIARYTCTWPMAYDAPGGGIGRYARPAVCSGT
eukprot:2309807-Prymnesium_polylepis.2